MATTGPRKTKKVRVSADDILNSKAKTAKKVADAKKYKTDSVDEVTEGLGSNTKLDAKKFSKEKMWYVLSVQSGHEASCAEAIKQRVEATGVQNLIGEVLIPTQKKFLSKVESRLLKKKRSSQDTF